jgi:hypothetical protein
MGLSALKSLVLSMVLAVVMMASTLAPVFGFPISSSSWVFAQTPVPEVQPPKSQVPQSSEPQEAPVRDVSDPSKVTPPPSPKPSAKVDRAAGPYDMEAIKAFDRDVYGAD